MQPLRKLSPMEQALTLMDRAYPLTAVCVLNLENGPPPEHLPKAFLALQTIHPGLRMGILDQGPGLWFAEASPCPPIPLEIIPRRDGTHWREIAQSALNRSVETLQPPLMRAVYLHDTPSGHSDLVLAFHHAIGDAASLTDVLHQLLQLTSGEDLSSEKYSLPPGADHLFPAKWRGLSLLRRLPAFFLRQMKDEFLFRRNTRHLTLPPIPAGTVNALEFIALEEPATRDLIRRSRQEGVSIAGLLSAAMLMAVRQLRYRNSPGAYRAIVFADLRPFLSPPVPVRQLGCYITMLRFTEKIGEADDLWKVARRLSEQVYYSGKRGERFLSAFLSKMLVQTTLRQASQRLGTTAISYAGPLSLQPQYGATSVRGIHGYITNNPLGAEYTAFGKIFDGRLELDIQYLSDEMTEQEARQIAGRVKELLVQASHPLKPAVT